MYLKFKQIFKHIIKMEIIALNQSYSPLGIEFIVHVWQGFQFIHYLHYNFYL